MLRKFAAALVATALIAGPALAQNSGNATPAAPQAQSPQAQSQPAPAMAPAKTTKTATPVTHARKHTAKLKSGVMHQARHQGRHQTRHEARHAKPAKSHQVRVGKTAIKSANKSATAAVKHS
jgi:hypothetical protein